MIDKTTVFEIEDALGQQEMPASILNLRCKACEKENFYKISEVKEFLGTPLSFATRARSSSTLLRSRNKLSRAANT